MKKVYVVIFNEFTVCGVFSTLYKAKKCQSNLDDEYSNILEVVLDEDLSSKADKEVS